MPKIRQLKIHEPASLVRKGLRLKNNGPSAREEKPKKAKDKRVNKAFHEVASSLISRGYVPIPLAGDKGPRWRRWQDVFCEKSLPVDEAERQGWIDIHGIGYRGVELAGVGVVMTNGLVCVDVDFDLYDSANEGKITRLKEILPSLFEIETPAVIGRKGLKAFFRCEHGSNRREDRISGRDTNGDLEILAWHQQAAIWPTIHPDTKRPYSWRSPLHSLLIVPLADLPILTVSKIEELRAAFAVPRQSKGKRQKHAAASFKEGTSIASQEAQAQKIADQKRYEATQCWDGDELELRRIAEALTYLSSECESQWWVIGRALKSFAGTHPKAGQVRKLWDVWAGGGEYLGSVFTGSEKFNATRQQQDEWDRLETLTGSLKTVASIIHEAAEAGFEKSLKRWPTLSGKRARNVQERPLALTGPIKDAAESLPQDVIAFGASREALRWHGFHKSALSPQAQRVLDVIIEKINHQYGGFAWISYKSIAKKLDIPHGNIKVLMCQLQNQGYLIKARNVRNPEGGIGMAYAIKPPPNMNWQQLVALHQTEMKDHRLPTPTDEKFISIGESRRVDSEVNEIRSTTRSPISEVNEDV